VSPEKEKRLIEVAQAYEAAAQKAVELREKRDKLRASMNEVQKQLEAAVDQAEATQRAMFEVVTAGLPPPGAAGH
jgi:chromosome segregation ATPase